MIENLIMMETLVELPMNVPDFSQHIPAIEDGVRLTKAGIYAKLAKRYASNSTADHAAKLAFCVTSGLFLFPLDHEKYRKFADEHRELIEEECDHISYDPELAEAASYVYAILIMLTTWQTRDLQIAMDLTERATQLGFAIPNIVQLWGSRAIEIEAICRVILCTGGRVWSARDRYENLLMKSQHRCPADIITALRINGCRGSFSMIKLREPSAGQVRNKCCSCGTLPVGRCQQ